MQTKPKVSIVILNWNGAKFLKEYLPSVLKTKYSNLEIIVGDNASSDNSLEVLSKEFNGVNVLSNPKNYGFAKGYNEILKQVGSDYYVLLNSDVQTPEYWLEECIDFMEKTPKAYACQPHIIDLKDKGKYEYAGAAGGYLDIWGFPFCKGRIFDTIENINTDYENNQEVFWASGACLIIRAEKYHKLGGLDEDFFAHMEEIDLCWRLKNVGGQIWSIGNSKVYHLGGGSLSYGNPRKVYLNFRNNLFMLLKNWPMSTLLWRLPIRMLIDYMAVFKFIISGEFSSAWAVIKAHSHFEWNFFKTLQKRQTRQTPLKKLTGLYKKSLIKAYFIMGKKYFSDLKLR